MHVIFKCMSTRQVIFIFLWFLTMTTYGQYEEDCYSHSSLKTEDSSLIKITRLKCNSNQSDFSPFLFDKDLYFVSGRTNFTGIEYRDENNNSEITDIFVARMQDSVRSSKPVSLPGKINTKFYEGPFTFSSKDGAMYFTANDRRNSLLKIFVTRKENNRWNTSKILPFCRDSFSYCHPTLSSGGDTLYFSSNITGGEGGMDIYRSVLTNGEWQTPVNSGTLINSPSNEIFPFCSRSGYLYFASDKPGGMGGIDLYKANEYSKVTENLVHPFNSNADDFGIWVDSTMQQGYFSTNRNPKYKDDLYHFANSMPDFYDAKSFVKKRTFCYTFFEEGTQQLQDTSNFEFEWRFGDGHKKHGLKTRHCYSAPGVYDVELNILQKVSGEVFASQASYTLAVDTPAYVGINCRDTITASSCLDIKYIVEGLSDYEVEKAYWSFGDGKYNTGASVKHIYKTPGEYTLTLYVLARDRTENRKQKFKAQKKIISKT